MRRAGDAVALEPIEHAFHALFAGPPDRRIISVKLRTLPLHAFTGTEGSNPPLVRRWPKVAGARLPPSPALIYLLSSEVLLPERAGGRDRFVAG